MDNRVVVISGGASGIGLATADELAASFTAKAPALRWQDIDSGISEIEGIIEMSGDSLETRGSLMLDGIGTSLSYDTSTNPCGQPHEIHGCHRGHPRTRRASRPGW